MNMRWIAAMSLLSVAAVAWAETATSEDTARAAARKDLAKRLQIEPERVSVVSETTRTWPNSSFGCPQRGMEYTQVTSAGAELVLDVAGQLYVYTAADGSTYVYCARPSQKRRGPVKAPIQ